MTGPSPRHHIIVGGTSGMGRAAAERLLARGDRVVVVGRNAARAQAVAQAMGVMGEGADEGGISAAINRAAQRLGRVDGLAITAGPIATRGDLLALSDADWAESFDTQLMTVVRSVRAILPLMQASGGGAIVTTAAYSIRAAKPQLPHYAAMKAAVASLTKSIAKGYGAAGIRANCIAPGAIATEALDGARAASGAADDAALWQAMRNQWGMRAALDRIGQPREVGELIAFLLSGEAAYLTGALINIDGGTDF